MDDYDALLLPGGTVNPDTGYRLTSWPSLWTELLHAGAEVLDQEVVIDGQLTTRRSPADLLLVECDVRRRLPHLLAQ